jgi:hypothetical protein
MTTPPRRGLRALAFGASGCALAAVFLAYLDPDLMLELANQVWACF